MSSNLTWDALVSNAWYENIVAISIVNGSLDLSADVLSCGKAVRLQTTMRRVLQMCVVCRILFESGNTLSEYAKGTGPLCGKEKAAKM